VEKAPHFNFTHDILQAVVPKTISPDALMRSDACAAIRTLLARGEHGDVMLDALQLVADLVRSKKCVCHPDAVKALLVLEFKDISREDVENGALLAVHCQHGGFRRARLWSSRSVMFLWLCMFCKIRRMCVRVMHIA
jgi:hypothetical protein